LLVIIFSLVSSIQLLMESLDLRGIGIGQDMMSRYESGFKELNEMVRGEKSVGYVFAEARDDSFANFQSRLARYFSTQYAMCPVIVDSKKRDGYIVGSFPVRHGEADIPRRLEAGNDLVDGQGLVLVRDFGNGVILFKRQGESKWPR